MNSADRTLDDLVGVATNDPDSGSDVVGADISSTNHDRPAGVAKALQAGKNPVCPLSSEISAVLQSEPTRTAFSDDACRLKEEAAPRPVDPFALGIVGAGDVLAGGRPNDDVWKSSKVGEESISRERADIVIDADIGVVLAIEGAPPVDHLAGGNGLEACAVQAKRPAAGRRAEEIKDSKHNVRCGSR